DLSHRVDHVRVDLLCRVAAGRANVDAAVRLMIQQRRRHLASAGVVDADEQDLRDFLHEHSLCLGERVQTLAAVAVNEQRNEGADSSAFNWRSDSSTYRAIVSREKTPANSRARSATV